jgi:hypothetical protein
MSNNQQPAVTRLLAVILIAIGAISAVFFTSSESNAQVGVVIEAAPRVLKALEGSRVLRPTPEILRPDRVPKTPWSAGRTRFEFRDLPLYNPQSSNSDVLSEGSVSNIPYRAPTDWKSWQDLPSAIPSTGIVIPKSWAQGALSPMTFPGIVAPFQHSASARGPPHSLELLNLSGLPYSEAVEALLIGPSQKEIGKYIKSPDGRYLLQLPSSQELPNGKYEIRLVADGAQSIWRRSIALSIQEGVALPDFMASDPTKLTLFISTEPIGKHNENYAETNTTYAVNDKGIKFLQGVTGEIDHAVVHYQDAFKNLSDESSYELKWKVTLNYARSLHDAVLWNHYDYAVDAKGLYETLLKEFQATNNRGFLSPKLSDFGITKEQILEPLRDLKALELQSIYVSTFLKGRIDNIIRFRELMHNIQSFVKGFLDDEEGMSSRLKITKEEIRQDLEALRNTIEKLSQPMLIELRNGDYIVKTIGASGISPLSVSGRNYIDPVLVSESESYRLYYALTDCRA